MTTIFEGSIIRAVRRLEELLNQLASAAKVRGVSIINVCLVCWQQPWQAGKQVLPSARDSLGRLQSPRDLGWGSVSQCWAAPAERCCAQHHPAGCWCAQPQQGRTGLRPRCRAAGGGPAAAPSRSWLTQGL